MPAQWLSDLAALARASQVIVQNHVVLRGQRAIIFGQTSSLVVAVREHTGISLPSFEQDKKLVLSQSQERSLHDSSRTSNLKLPSAHADCVGPQLVQERFSATDHYYTPFDSIPSVNVKTNNLQIKQEENLNQPLLSDSLAARESGQGSTPSETSIKAQDLPSARDRSVQQDLEFCRTSEKSRKYRILKDGGGAEAPCGSDGFKGPSRDTGPTLSSLHQAKSSTRRGDNKILIERPEHETVGRDVLFSQNVGSNATIAPKLQGSGPEPGSPIEQLFHNPRIGRALLGREKGINPYEKIVKPMEPQSWPPRDRSATVNQDNNYEPNYQLTNHLTPETVSREHQTEQSRSKSLNISSKSITTPIQMRESRVPSSRLGRMWQYAGLGASMTFGAAAESFRRLTQPRTESAGSLMLNSANIERLVTKLSRMRGAALKIGQLLSFQDSKLLPPAISQVLQRVQDSADYMPARQRNQVLQQNLGADWKDLFTFFDEQPLAAASIGQVHAATLRSNNESVVVKIQYPGVAESIDSDLGNLSMLLTASRLLPKGLYLDKTIKNAQTELAWECDYVREADAAKTFQTLLKDEQNIFTVPRIYDDACGKQVLTMERMQGTAVAKIQDLSQDQKDWIGSHILRLCLREITEFKYMQTDPNWTNFLYNHSLQRIELLDFGASRRYSDTFIEIYVRLLLAASRDDHERCRELSVRLGYLTGMESKLMLDAHVKSITILAEPFKETAPDIYDFSNQTITDRVKALIPVMLRERLAPPPEETYSLHRKLSGAFLLLARLGSKVDTKAMFRAAMDRATMPE